MTQETNTRWRAEVLKTVVSFAKDVEDVYRGKIREATQLVPVKTDEALLYIRNAFMDGLTGMFSVLTVNSVGYSLEMEEIAVKAIREKFKELRTQKFKADVMKQ